MKKLLYFLILWLLYSCGRQSNSGLTPEQTQQLTDEIKSTISQMFDCVYKVDLKKYLEFFDSTDFTQIVNGQILDWKTFRTSNQDFWSGLEYQKIKSMKEFITVINSETANYTIVGSDEGKFRNGGMMKVDPIAITLFFKKINGSWKVTFYHGSMAFQTAPPQADSILTRN
jgi:hypothetical protein